MGEDIIESGGVKWTRDEYDEISELGFQGKENMDIPALQELYARFEAKGAFDKALEIETAMGEAVDGWTTDVLQNTGVSLTYVEGLYNNKGGWREASTGQFVGKLNYTVYGSNDEDYMQYLIDKVSPWL